MIESGGTMKGDLYGSSLVERVNSNPYKTVYLLSGEPRPDFEGAKFIKGDAFYETSVGDNSKTRCMVWRIGLRAVFYVPFLRSSGVPHVRTLILELFHTGLGAESS